MIVDKDTLASQIDKLSPSTREKLPHLIENLVNHSGKINRYIHYKTHRDNIKIIDCDHFLNKRLIKFFLIVCELKNQFLCIVFMIKWDYILVFLNKVHVFI